MEEAKGLARDQLGVAEEDTEFEVLEEPRSGLFGRVKGEARVRARVRPTAVRPKIERRDRKKSGGRDGAGKDGAAKDGAVKEGAVKEGTSRDGAPREQRPPREPREPARQSAGRDGSDTVAATSGSRARPPQKRREP